MREYLSKVKYCCDFIASIGHKVSKKDQILHILFGLGIEYDPVMVTITSKMEAWIVNDVHALLLSFESRLESLVVSAINTNGSQNISTTTHTSTQKEVFCRWKSEL